jgi:hypothetical protein
MTAFGTILPGLGWRMLMPKGNQNAFDNELLAAIVAVALSGFVTLVLWVMFGS